MRCLGGEIFGRLTPLNESQEQRIQDLGLESELNRVYTSAELASGDEVGFFCAGVTDGPVVRGVRAAGAGHRVHTLVMHSGVDRLRFVDSIHPFSAFDAPIW